MDRYFLWYCTLSDVKCMYLVQNDHLFVLIFKNYTFKSIDMTIYQVQVVSGSCLQKLNKMYV